MKYLLLFVSVFWLGCGEKHPETAEDYALLADRFCRCSEPLYKAIMETASDLNDRGITNEDEIKALLGESIKKYTEETKTCLNKKLGKEWMSIIVNDMKDIAAIQQKCPKYAPIVIAILTDKEESLFDKWIKHILLLKKND